MRRMLVALLFLNLIPIVHAADEKAASGHYKAAEQLLTLMDTPNVLRQSIDQMVKIQS